MQVIGIGFSVFNQGVSDRLAILSVPAPLGVGLFIFVTGTGLMGRAASRIRKTDVTRLIEAVRAAGLEPQGVKVSAGGEITVITGKVELDELDRELAAFEAKHARAS